MKCRASALLVFFVSCTFAQSPKASPPLQLTTYTIAGTVVNSVTNAPVADARVALVETQTRKNKLTVTTQANGHFVFDHLPAGKYSLRGAKKGYITSAYEQHERYSTAIVTGPEMNTESLRLRLQPTAIISGKVSDESGEPVRRARVSLFRAEEGAGPSRIMRIAISVTDDRGYYDFGNLLAGTYFVSVTANPWYALRGTSAEAAPGDQAFPVPPALDVTYPTTYYDNATESENAHPIALAAGDHAAIDVHLTAVPALHIRIRVPSNPQIGFQIPTFQKRVFDGTEWSQPDAVFSVQPDICELSGISPGRYIIRIPQNGAPEGPQILEMNLQRDGEELDLTKAVTLANLKISVKMLGGEQPLGRIGITLVDQKNRPVTYGQMQPGGNVLFEGVTPATYALKCVSSEGACAVTRIASGTLESVGHDLSLEAGAQQEATAWISRGLVTVQGVVHKGGRPTPGVMVVLIPKDPEAHLEYFRRDQSDFDGTFRVAGIIPGSYTIVAVENAWGTPWREPAVLSRYEKHGQELTIGPLMRGVVHLPDPVEVQPK